MTKSIAAAAAFAILAAATAPAAFAQGVDITASDVYQLSVADYYVQYSEGSGEQVMSVNDISGEAKIDSSVIVQYNETELFQLKTDGDQTMNVNRIRGE